ncbi:MAG: N-acetyltransferase [Pseudomonadales bacterium]|jgi:GNAT superfamily N-acetyltransferase
MSSPYRIVEVTDRKTLTDFIHAPRAAQGADPNWVPPLDLMKREDFSPGHPYFQHAEWQPFVAYEGNRPVGRISAQIDRLYHEYHDPCTGFFGLIEGIDDPVLFRALTEVAEYWLRDRGMTRILGPFNLGINQEVGLLVDGFDTPPYFLMGHAQPYYSRRLEALGYRGCQDMLAYLAPPHFELPRLFARQLRRVEKEAVIRPLDRSRKKEELEAVRDIFNDAWSENWGFVPFTPEEFEAVGNELMYVVPKDLAVIAEHEGQPVGFIVMVPNINEIITDLDGKLLPFGWAKLLWRLKVRFPQTARVPLMGVRKAYHHLPLGPSLAIALIENVRKAGYNRGARMIETSWILEDNDGMRKIMEHIGGEVSKRYRMYEKDLP